MKTRQRKIDEIKAYCDSFIDCNSGCGLLELADCDNISCFEKLTDEQLDICLEAIRKKKQRDFSPIKTGDTIYYYNEDENSWIGKLIKETENKNADCVFISDNERYVGIKDSGNRREFETGAVRDMQEGKGRMDLLPWAAILEVSKHCEAGAKKYGEHNVDKGIPTNSLCDSAARHLAKYLDGWTDENHLLAAAWNLLWCIEMTIKKPEMVNTPFEIKVSK